MAARVAIDPRTRAWRAQNSGREDRQIMSHTTTAVVVARLGSGQSLCAPITVVLPVMRLIQMDTNTRSPFSST